MQAHRAAQPIQPGELFYVRLWLLFLAFFTKPREQLLRVERLDPSIFDDDECSRRIRFHSLAAKSRFTLALERVAMRDICTYAGLSFLALYTTESSYQLYTTLFERATHLHLVVGASRGVCLFGVWVLLMLQCAATAALLVPAVYRRIGPMPPSITLSLTTMLEVVAFGDLRDATTALGMVCTSASAALLGVVRYDRQQRDVALQLPTNGRLLGVQEHVHTLCTATSAGAVCPPLAALSTYSALSNAFWRARPLLVEYMRARHKLALGASALLLLLAAQDRDGSKRLTVASVFVDEQWKRFTHTATAMCARVRAMRNGRHAPNMGRKKDL